MQRFGSFVDGMIRVPHRASCQLNRPIETQEADPRQRMRGASQQKTRAVRYVLSNARFREIPSMGLWRRFRQLFHRDARDPRDKPHALPVDAARIDEAIGRILAIHPRLKLARRYRQRLKRPIALTLQYADELIASLPATLDGSAAAWSSQPSLRAFFATPADIADTFGRSTEVRAFFERHPEADDVQATLGMALFERHVLGVALEGDALRQDVVQTTLSFSDHRVTICGSTEAALRTEIMRHFIDQMALEGLARLPAPRAAPGAGG